MPTNRLFAILCLFSTFIIYFEWGTDQQEFLIEMEGEVLLKSLEQPKSVLHPLIIFPLIGQLLLVYIAIYPQARRILPILALSLFGILVFFVLLAGVSGGNTKMILFALPFVFLSSWWLIKRKKQT
jgi:hypothetical protein